MIAYLLVSYFIHIDNIARESSERCCSFDIGTVNDSITSPDFTTNQRDFFLTNNMD